MKSVNRHISQMPDGGGLSYGRLAFPVLNVQVAKCFPDCLSVFGIANTNSAVGKQLAELLIVPKSTQVVFGAIRCLVDANCRLKASRKTRTAIFPIIQFWMNTFVPSNRGESQ